MYTGGGIVVGVGVGVGVDEQEGIGAAGSVAGPVESRDTSPTTSRYG